VDDLLLRGLVNGEQSAQRDERLVPLLAPGVGHLGQQPARPDLGIALIDLDS
jgi:hypothetical protein